MDSSACILNRGGVLGLILVKKNLEGKNIYKNGESVKRGDSSTVLTYKLSLEFFSLSSVRIHMRMAYSTQVSVFPGAAPNLSAISCHTEARALG